MKDEITVQDLLQRTDHVVRKEADIVRDQLARNGDRVIVAVGSRPARPVEVEFDGKTVIDSDGVLGLDHIPTSLVVVGAGVIGIEYASMFAALKTKVTVVDRRDRMLEFADVEMVDALRYHLRDWALSSGSGSRSPLWSDTRAGPRPFSPAGSGFRPMSCFTPPADRAPPTPWASTGPGWFPTGAVASR